MWHPDLWMNLAIGGSLSIAFGDHIYAIPIYPYCPMDYPLVLCLFYHHMSLGGFGMYNCISVVRFHYFWKMQSDLWGNP